eukprot:s1558_g24.t1
MDADNVSLEQFLAGCNPTWSLRDRTSVVRKLGRIGVRDVSELVRLEQRGTLNDMLAAAGERRFNAETLASIRMAGSLEPGGEEDILDEFAQLLSDFVTRTSSPSSSSSPRRRLHVQMSDELFRRQVNRGLAYVDQAAKEVHLRNEHLSRCLDEVQDDITRIAHRMQAARRERERGRAATSAAASRLFTDKSAASKAPEPLFRAAASSRKDFATPPRAPSAGMKTPIRKSGSAGGSPRCARAAQEGFRFGGGWQPPAKVAEADRVSRPHQVLQDVLLLLQDAVRSQLSSLRHESKAHQKAAVKRLLVQWHPDRNLESQETATAIFQFIQQEKEKMLGLGL